MKRLLSNLLAAALLLGCVITPATAKTFSDTQGHWAEASIDSVSDLGLFQGTGNLFLPEDTMTRGMFITVLARLAEGQGLTVDTAGTNNFTDVDADAYYSGYVTWATENQIASGMSDSKFAPDAAVTREQMCVLLVNFLNWAQVDVVEGDGVSFVDQSSISGWAVTATAIAQGLGLIQGVAVEGGMAFQPQNSATRSAVATVFVRLLDYLETGRTQADILAEAEIADYLSAMIENYNNSTYLTTTDPLVQETMATLVSCMEMALEERENGVFLTRDYVQTTYSHTIQEMKTLYSQLTETQYNQFFNVVVRLGTTDAIYTVMDFFGVSYLG